MGAFKPLLPFGNSTVIDTCLNHLNGAGVKQIVVVLGHRAEDIQKAMRSVPAKFVINPNPDTEMSSSIELGVGAISKAAEAVLITPVDHPAVPPQIIQSLIDNWRGGAKLIQPEFEGKGGHPVLIDLTFRHELMNLAEESSLRGFFASHRQEVLRLPVNSPFVAQDMDTWDDYLNLHQAVFGHKPTEFVETNDANN
jgi:CTP:molybdopterin cytidylyltransferase MocA